MISKNMNYTSISFTGVKIITEYTELTNRSEPTTRK